VTDRIGHDHQGCLLSSLTECHGEIDHAAYYAMIAGLIRHLLSRPSYLKTADQDNKYPFYASRQ
jgi:hypothetical protein